VENYISKLTCIIRDRLTNSDNNRSEAVRFFREQDCIDDDERLGLVFDEALTYLTHRFSRSEGRIKLTATSIALGSIAERILTNQNRMFKPSLLKIGDCLIGAMIELNLLILEREGYRSLEEVIDRWVNKEGELEKKVNKVNYTPYLLRPGRNFAEYELNPMMKNGISRRRYPTWKGKQRYYKGIKEELIKSSVKLSDEHINSKFMEAVNHNESVKWIINPHVAEVTAQLRDMYSNTRMILDDGVVFDCSDIDRTGANAHLAGKELKRNGKPFEPERGNSNDVKVLEATLNKLEKKKVKLKSPKAIGKLAERIAEINEVYEEANLRWTDKQFCLRKHSKASRDKRILDTIHGLKDMPGWLNYSFYFSYFLDYRGRVYAKEPYFNYQSNDLARGHLMFAEGKRIGKRGIEWLWCHAAASYNETFSIENLKWTQEDYVSHLTKHRLSDISVDKMSFVDRYNWTENNLDLITEIALEPLENMYKWLDAEKPLVFLACCFEIIAVLANGEDYVSKLPIPVDANSSGTQHFAAMSRDEVAGEYVGLIPRAISLDFYLAVGQRMLDANMGTKLGKKLAPIPMKLVRKGLSKRGTMTKGYSAGLKCISDIIYQDSYDCGIVGDYDLSRADSWKLGKDLVDAYDQICSGPVRIKNYLQQLVEYRLSKNIKNIYWETPSGFPVMTEKWIRERKRVTGYICDKQYNHVYMEYLNVPARHELASGISPNVVHSYDAAHMALVICRLKDNGNKSFGAIHDSFSVHACDVDELIDVTKDEFIKMYTIDILNDLKNQITMGDCPEDIVHPDIGNLDLELIRDSEYFFA